MNLSQPVLILALSLSLAAQTFAAAVIESATFNGGGGTATSGVYELTASLGLIGGDASSGSVSNSSGGVESQPAVKTLIVHATPGSIAENATSQLSGTAVLEDDTVTALSGAELTWSSSGIPYPLALIDSNGLVTATNVYQETAATVNGFYQGLLTNLTVTVLDSMPDNYASYAGDGLPDHWQAQYFGLDNTQAGPAVDADGDGQDNRFEYTAGLVPTNAASRFSLRIVNVAGQPAQRQLIFSPLAPDRTYTAEYRTNLVGGVTWQPLAASSTSDNGSERTVTDLDSTGPAKFYQIKITAP